MAPTPEPTAMQPQFDRAYVKPFLNPYLLADAATVYSPFRVFALRLSDLLDRKQDHRCPACSDSRCCILQSVLRAGATRVEIPPFASSPSVPRPTSADCR